MASQMHSNFYSVVGTLLAIVGGNGFFDVLLMATPSGFVSVIDNEVKMKPPRPKPAFTIPVRIPSLPGMKHQAR